MNKRYLLAMLVATLIFFSGGWFVVSAQTLSCEQPGTTERKLTFINQCKQDIWIGAFGNVPGPKCMSNSDCPSQDTFCSPIASVLPKTCSSNAGCDPGDFCEDGHCKFRQCNYVPLKPGAVDITSGQPCSNNNQCTDSQYCNASSGRCAAVLTDGNGWEMKQDGSSETVCAPTPWAGRFWARTGCGDCTGGECLCDTGQCLGNDGKTFSQFCAVSGLNPVTIVEPNMRAFGPRDFYDISMVNGGNVPAQIVPDVGSFDLNAGINDKFYCGRPGCVDPNGCQAMGSANNLLPHCDWKGDLAIEKAACTPSVLQKLGQDGTTYVGCLTPNSVCPNDPQNQLECGTTSSLLCSEDSDCGTNQQCNTGTGRCMTATTTNQNLYQCSGSNVGSCYTHRTCSKPNDPLCDASHLPPGFHCDTTTGLCVNPNCCGCPSWAPPGECFAGDNAEWQSVTKPFYEGIFRDACPLSYSFAYDDPGVTFTCQGHRATNNVNYTITFCPK